MKPKRIRGLIQNITVRPRASQHGTASKVGHDQLWSAFTHITHSLGPLDLLSQIQRFIHSFLVYFMLSFLFWKLCYKWTIQSNKNRVSDLLVSSSSVKHLWQGYRYVHSTPWEVFLFKNGESYRIQTISPQLTSTDFCTNIGHEMV